MNKLVFLATVALVAASSCRLVRADLVDDISRRINSATNSIRSRLPSSPSMPQVNMPDMPQVNMPDMPQMNMPDMPKINMPDMPKINMPDISMPNMPNISLPNMPDMPQISMPDINMPDIDMPDFDMPDMPQINMPDMPQIRMPDMSRVPGWDTVMKQMRSLESQLTSMLPSMPESVRGQMNDMIRRIRSMVNQSMPN